MEQLTDRNRRTRFATIKEYAAIKGVTPKKVHSWVRQKRVTALRDNGRTLIDLEAPPAGHKAEKAIPAETRLPTRQELLQTFLAKAEAAVRNSEISRKRWQLLAFVSMLLLAATLYAAVWAYARLGAINDYRPPSYMGEGSLQAANMKVAELTQQIEQLQVTNASLTLKNAGLAAQYSLLATEGQLAKESIEAEPAPPASPAYDQQRLNDIRNRLYPADMMKDELIAALGKPDRTYKTEIYEQLVYFSRPPTRFWFKSGPYLHAVR